MPKVSARRVLRMLTDDQNRTWLNITRYLLSRYEDYSSDLIERGFVCLFDFILYVSTTNFQLKRDGPSWVEPVLS